MKDCPSNGSNGARGRPGGSNRRFPRRNYDGKRPQFNKAEALVLEGMNGSRNGYKPAARSKQELPEIFEARGIRSEAPYLLIDSGASHHVVNDARWFTELDKNPGIRKVKVGSCHKLQVQGSGSVSLTVGDKRRAKLILKNVLLVPRMRKNLISVSKLTDEGYTVSIQRTEAIISKGKDRIRAKETNGLYRLEVSQEMAFEFGQMLAVEDRSDESDDYDMLEDAVDPEDLAPGIEQIDDTSIIENGSNDETYEEKENAPNNQGKTTSPLEDAPSDPQGARGSDQPSNLGDWTKKQPVSLKQVHELFAHINKEALKQLLNLEGIKYTEDFDQCETCIQAKQTRSSYRNRPEDGKASDLGTFTGDLCSTSEPSLGGNRYFLLLTEEYSRYKKVYLMKNKDSTPNCISHYISWFENQTGKRLKRFMSDQGSEFLNQTLKEVLDKKGIVQTYSNVYSAQQNGIAERGHRTLLNYTRALLVGSKLPRYLWAEALNYSADMFNMVTINKTLNKSAFEIIHGRKPYFGRMHAFGSRCFSYVYHKKKIRSAQSGGRLGRLF